MSREFHPFDVFKVPLEGIHLIEASAGTGKTYSITLLVLRMLLEKKIPIQEILLLTYTNAAVAELEIRIRQFIRRAHYLAQRKSRNASLPTDGEILRIFEQANQGDDKSIADRLEDAMLFMDELKVMTIHGFCQRTLKDYALETGQLFDSEIKDDFSASIEKEVHHFWRNEITVLPAAVIRCLLEKRFDQELFIKATDKIIEGYRCEKNGMPEIEQLMRACDYFLNSGNRIRELVMEYFPDLLSANEGQKLGKRSNVQRAIYYSDPELLITELSVAIHSEEEFNKKTGYPEMQRCPRIIERLEALKAGYDSAEHELEQLVNALLYRFQEEAIPRIQALKNRNSVLSFADLTRNMYRALHQDANAALVSKLQWAYKAVFVDEFQDTDHWQYGIFKAAFHTAKRPMVFYIGDPKQLIYSWRGADPEMYKRAALEIPERYTMHINYRSTEIFIEALNRYFPTGRDCCNPELISPFCDDIIRYFPVKAGKKGMGVLKIADKNVAPLCFLHQEKATDEQALEAMALQVLHLLHNGTIREVDGSERRIKPRDIALLVRKNAHGIQLKRILAQYRVPAVVIDETKVSSTETAEHLHHLLVAFLDLKPGHIRRALYSPFTPRFAHPGSHPRLEAHILEFSTCHRIWLEHGVFAAVQRFLATYRVRQILLDADNPMGERIYSNLIQLLEILNSTEYFRRLSPEKLTDWLAKAIENPPEISSYEQRLETDEMALHISTIHKSKGLQYPIVLLPLINLRLKAKTPPPFSLISYRNEDGQYRLRFNPPNESVEQQKQLEEQAENRRLYYVALTRAIYAAFVFDNGKDGMLRKFRIPEDSGDSIGVQKPVQAQAKGYTPEKTPDFPRKPLPFTGNSSVTKTITSYSALDSHIYSPLTIVNPGTHATTYDEFIFETLSKGAQTGNFLHHLLEHIDFTNTSAHPVILERTMNLFGISPEDKKEPLLEMIDHIIGASIAPGDRAFSLECIPQASRLNEMEFYFDFKRWDLSQLPIGAQRLQSLRFDYPGVMHGYIDLLFEHDGRYYVLDWKSNHLGYTLEDYAPATLEAAMIANNYTLQYHIYTLAATRYLRAKLPDFDYDRHFGGVIYLFLRGARRGLHSGVFTTTPDKATIAWLEAMTAE